MMKQPTINDHRRLFSRPIWLAFFVMLLTLVGGVTAMAAPTTIAIEGRLMTAAGGPVADCGQKLN